MLICLFRHFRIGLVGLILSTLPALSHEFWIEPQKYQVESGAPVLADLRNGQNFSGANQVFFARRTRRFEFTQSGQTTAYQGRMGDLPAFQLDQADPGLLIITHETAPQTITYETWEKFQTFADHKGFADISQRHQARGLPEQGFAETYTRHAKSLIAVGDGIGSDKLLGMEAEFVALANPYTDDLSLGLPVRVYYLGTPRANAQIEIFERGPDDVVLVSLQRADAQGVVLIPVKPGHTYLLDAVVLRPSRQSAGPVWETLWAALTFTTP
ncbi:DUF4198 domain-containing protein [Parasedimentitalea psychrophila]|nr:DUF4198 domain-containing protein [Parasedimentitalea psychrophila]